MGADDQKAKEEATKMDYEQERKMEEMLELLAAIHGELRIMNQAQGNDPETKYTQEKEE